MYCEGAGNQCELGELKLSWNEEELKLEEGR